MKQRIYDSMKGIEIILFLGRQNHVIPGDISPSRDPIAIVSSPFILSENISHIAFVL